MPSRPRSESSKLFARAKRTLPGGVNSPVRAFGAVGGEPPFIKQANGAKIEDVDGRRYIDYVMSWGPLIHGHTPKELTRTLGHVVRLGTSFGGPTAIEVKLGQRVCSMVPSVERVRFVNSGTEATMSAVRVARAATQRDHIIKFAGCYHGHADQFLVQAGSGATTLGIPNSPGVPRSTVADTLVARFNDIVSVRELCRTHSGTIAAIIVEPIAGNMGVVLPAPGFLENLRRLCNRHGIVLIFDEVLTGFRVGKGGAQEYYGVRPDLTCFGKIIGAGLPVGAYGGRTDLMDLVAPAGPVYQAGTLSGNPLAMTAGEWALGRLSTVLYRRLEKLGQRLAAGLSEVAQEAGVPLHVNSLGSMLTPFFTDHPVTDFASALKANTNTYAKFFHGMLARGIYPPPSQFEAWFLSASHTVREIDDTIQSAREALADVNDMMIS
jgi:glutamate-1-semialdehyde 2,1-aminomutase